MSNPEAGGPPPEAMSERLPQLLIAVAGVNYIASKMLETEPAPDNYFSVSTDDLRDALRGAPKGHVYFRLDFSGNAEPPPTPRVLRSASKRASALGTLTATPPPLIEFANERIRIDSKRREAYADREPVPLTTMEFDILQLLGMNAGQVVTREELHDNIWPHTPKEIGRTLQSQISYIRNKLGRDDLGNPDRGAIKNVRGVGFCALLELPRP